MRNRLLRAGENRKLARNLRENLSARQIGVAGLLVAKLLAPVLVLFGLSIITTAAYAHSAGHGPIITTAAYAHSAGHGHLMVGFGVAGLVSGGRDFLEVMDEAEQFAPSLRERSSHIQQFQEKLDRFIGLIVNKAGMPSHRRTYLMKEAETTTDFPILFGTVLERQLAARYSIAKPEWRQYIKTGTQNDFRKANILGVFGLESSMDEVAQRGEYKGSAYGDGKVENVIKKYGRRFDISWETLINDDLGAFSETASKLANAALVTEIKQAALLFVVAAGPNTSLIGNSITHPIDGGVFDNLTTDLFDVDALGDAITAMRSQLDTNGNPIEIGRFHLVVPPALEIPMLKALSTGALIAAAGATGSFVQTSENVVAKLPLTGHVNPYIPTICTGANKNKMWWIFAENPSGGTPACQMNFLRGHESPEIVQKMSNKVALGGGPVSQLEGDFESDSAAWRVRHCLGGTQVDPRFAYASDGSGS